MANARRRTFLEETDRHYIPVPDKDGGCNSDAWYQIPGHPDFFAGRYIESKTCTPDGSVPDGTIGHPLALPAMPASNPTETSSSIARLQMVNTRLTGRQGQMAIQVPSFTSPIPHRISRSSKALRSIRRRIPGRPILRRSICLPVKASQ